MQMYSVLELLPTIFQDIYEHPPQVNRLQYLFTALRDPAPMLRNVQHVENKVVPCFSLCSPFLRSDACLRCVCVCVCAILAAPHTSHFRYKTIYLESFKKEVLGMFAKNIVDPLCR